MLPRTVSGDRVEECEVGLFEGLIVGLRLGEFDGVRGPTSLFLKAKGLFAIFQEVYAFSASSLTPDHC